MPSYFSNGSLIDAHQLTQYSNAGILSHIVNLLYFCSKNSCKIFSYDLQIDCSIKVSRSFSKFSCKKFCMIFASKAYFTIKIKRIMVIQDHQSEESSVACVFLRIADISFRLCT